MRNLLLAMTFVGLLNACAGSTSPEPTGAAPSPSPSQQAADDGWSHAYDLVGLDGFGCVTASSADISRVRLRGETCTDDGGECYDAANHTVEVWATAAADSGPFGVASWVSVKPCE
jgi:hypothetical protein